MSVSVAKQRMRQNRYAVILGCAADYGMRQMTVEAIKLEWWFRSHRFNLRPYAIF